MAVPHTFAQEAEEPTESQDSVFKEEYKSSEHNETDILQQITQAQKKFNDASVDITSLTKEEVTANIQEAEKIKNKIETDTPVELEYTASQIVSLLITPIQDELKTTIQNIMQRLQIPGDITKFKIIILGSLEPNANIDSEKSELSISFGLLASTRSIDELAFILGHELTHQNRALGKALDDNADLKKFLDKFPDYQKYNRTMREEIRADLGGVYRMIQAGYNPWAAYDQMKNFARLHDLAHTRSIRLQVNSFLSTHPAPVIRSVIIKTYITSVMEQQNLQKISSQRTPYPLKIRLFNEKLYNFIQFLKNPIHKEWMGLLAVFLGMSTLYYIHHHPEVMYYIALGGILPLYAYRRYQNFKKNMTLKNHLEVLSEAAKQIQRNTKDKRENIKSLLQGLEEASMLYKALEAIIAKDNKKESSILSAAKKSILQDVNSAYADVLTKIHLYIIKNPDFEDFFKTKIKDSLLGENEIQTKKPNAFRFKLSVMAFQNSTVTELLTQIFKLNVDKKSQKPSDAFLFRLHTLRTATLHFNTSTPSEKIRILFNMISCGLKYMALDYFVPVYQELENAIIHPKSKDPASAYKFSYVVKTLSEFKNLRAPLRKLFKQTVGLIKSNPGKALANWSFLSSAIDPDHAGIELYENTIHLPNSIVPQLIAKSKNITDLADKIINHSLRNNLILFNMRWTLVEGITNHPELIQRPEDAEALLRHEFFWPSDLSLPRISSQLNISQQEETLLSILEEAGFNKHLNYDAVLSEKIQRMYVEALHKFQKYPKDFKSKYELWKRLAQRQNTYFTDVLFKEIYFEANDNQKIKMENYIHSEQRVFDDEIHNEISRNKLARDPEYQKLLAEPASDKRLHRVKGVVKIIEKLYPNKGRNYSQALEDLSVQIQSTEAEAGFIEKSKTQYLKGNTKEDFGLRILSFFVNRILSRSKQVQWELILFLRGDIPATESVQQLVQHYGTERLKQNFQILSLENRTGLLDMMLESQNSILGKNQNSPEDMKKIVTHLFKDLPTEKQEISKHLLDSLLYAFEKTKNTAYKTTLISYLLAHISGKHDSSNDLLKNILEFLGATGIKIGQLLAISEALPQDQKEMLRTLQERAKPPVREKIYTDLRNGLGNSIVTYVIQKLVGSASIKYVVQAINKVLNKKVVLKVFRPETLNTIQYQFEHLNHMVDYLIIHYKSRYGFLRSIVNSAQKAVSRELVAKNEPIKSKLAAEHIYTETLNGELLYEVPKEFLLKNNIIESDYAEGVSFHELPEELKTLVAESLLNTEVGNLMSKDKTFVFDPDRHKGNFKVQILFNKGLISAFKIRPFDFGQLSQITSQERDTILNLFSLSQILAKTGAIQWASSYAKNILNLSDSQTHSLEQQFKEYFPNTEMKPMLAYLNLLTCLYEIKFNVPTTFTDYIKSLIQLSDYEIHVKNPATLLPKKVLEAETLQRIEVLQKSLRLSMLETVKYGWNKLFKKSNPAQTKETLPPSFTCELYFNK